MLFSPACPCCCGCSNRDVLLLCDITGSMTSIVGFWQDMFDALKEDFNTESCYWAVASYRDVWDEGYADGWAIQQQFTQDWDLVTAGLNQWAGAGGGDWGEENIIALRNAATYWDSQAGLAGREWQDGIKRVILWAGDAPSHTGSVQGKEYGTVEETITALNNAHVAVMGCNMWGAGAGIDANSQASQICDATGGRLFNNLGYTSYEKFHDALCRALTA